MTNSKNWCKFFFEPQRIVSNTFFCIILLLCETRTLSFAQTPTRYKGREEKLPIAVAPQPIPFSHQKHTSVSCLYCHVYAAKQERAGFPNSVKCIPCHITEKKESPLIQKLLKIHKKGEKIKWVRVYQVPDFVFFSHASHVKANIECKTCHGPVHKRDVLAKEVSTGMVSCMNCHDKMKVSNSCYLCHDLGQ